MGFVMQGLDAEDYDRQYSDRELLRRIGGYFRPAAGAMALVGAMITLNSIMQMIQPLAISEGIDRIRDDGAGSVLWWLTAVILLAGVMAWGFNYVRQTVTARVVGDVVLALRTDAGPTDPASQQALRVERTELIRRLTEQPQSKV